MVFKAQIGEELILSQYPTRIISLVPSQTEFLYDLGLKDEIVGITKFCIHPKEDVKGVTKIGGTKNFHLDTIHKLKPDLIIGNKEENYKEGIEELKRQFPVWISDITNLEEAFHMMRMIGGITNRVLNANRMIDRIKNNFLSLPKFEVREALYLIWKKPYMSVGGDTFINHMMHYAGFKNLLEDAKRYPEISVEEIKRLQPEYILLSSEPYPFKEKHINEFIKISPKSKILIVDGEMFSWYGSRLQYVAQYFQELSKL